ncbi:MAG: FHA domain-containing protein [Chloroflexota bacterium]
MDRGNEDLPVVIGQGGKLDGQRWYIQAQIYIGRDDDCDIVVADRQVSRKHIRLEVSKDGVYLHDLGSKNGTHYNGNRISEVQLLSDGDIVQVALAQKFVYISSDSTLPLELDHTTDVYIREGRLSLDKRARRVVVVGNEITPPLSVAQFTLLEMLYKKEGKVATREELIRGIWHEEEAFEVSNQALDALVRRLRDRIREVDSEHEYVITVRGHGLRIENPAE